MGFIAWEFWIGTCVGAFVVLAGMSLFGLLIDWHEQREHRKRVLRKFRNPDFWRTKRKI